MMWFAVKALGVPQDATHPFGDDDLTNLTALKPSTLSKKQ